MSEKKPDSPQCDLCSIEEKACRMENGTEPIFCLAKNKKETIRQAITEYEKPVVREFAGMASIQEAECWSGRSVKPYVLHPVKPRVQEICEFAKKMILDLAGRGLISFEEY